MKANDYTRSCGCCDNDNCSQRDAKRCKDTNRSQAAMSLCHKNIHTKAVPHTSYASIRQKVSFLIISSFVAGIIIDDKLFGKLHEIDSSGARMSECVYVCNVYLYVHSLRRRK